MNGGQAGDEKKVTRNYDEFLSQKQLNKKEKNTAINMINVKTLSKWNRVVCCLHP